MLRDDTYKYMGIVIRSKLKWDENTESMMNKYNSMMYCLGKSRNLESELIVLFTQCFPYSLGGRHFFGLIRDIVNKYIIVNIK